MLTHNVCTVIWRRSPATGEIEMLVVEARSKHPKTGVWTEWRVKFPGGGQDGPNESIEGTRDREVWQETNLAFLRSKLIWRKVVQNPEEPEHHKYGYLVNFEDCYGELRNVPKTEPDGDELRIPGWVPAATLGRSLFASHQALFLAACRGLGFL